MKESQSVLLILKCKKYDNLGIRHEPDKFYYFEPGTFPYANYGDLNLCFDCEKSNQETLWYLQSIGGQPIDIKRAIRYGPDIIYELNFESYRYGKYHGTKLSV